MRKKSLPFLVLFVLGISFTLSAQDSKKVASNVISSKQNTVTVTQNIPYRESGDKAHFLDLAMPANFGEKTRPAIVIIHGGGWSGGSKEDGVYQKFMLSYAQKGYVTININYRLTGQASFPACIEDVKCAVRWLRAHSKEYNVDPDRIGAFGHSAGAHLALMLAVTDNSAGLEGNGGWDKYSSKVNVVVGGSPPTELGRSGPMAKKEWWPIGYIASGKPAMLLIQGGDDRVVRPELTEDYVAKMKSAGSPVEYIRIDGVGHDVAYSVKLDVTNPAIEKFFATHLNPQL
jgi:acetyl esterase/lipase